MRIDREDPIHYQEIRSDGEFLSQKDAVNQHSKVKLKGQLHHQFNGGGWLDQQNPQKSADVVNNKAEVGEGYESAPTLLLFQWQPSIGNRCVMRCIQRQDQLGWVQQRTQEVPIE